MCYTIAQLLLLSCLVQIHVWPKSFTNLDAEKTHETFRCGPEMCLDANVAQAPSAPSRSLLGQGWDGTGVPSTDAAEKLEGFQLGGFSVGPGTPQELVTSRITIGHLPVLKVLFLHPNLGEELPELPKDVMLHPITHPYVIQRFLDFVLRGTFSMRTTQEHAQEAAVTAHHLIAGEAQVVPRT